MSAKCHNQTHAPQQSRWLLPTRTLIVLAALACAVAQIGGMSRPLW